MQLHSRAFLLLVLLMVTLGGLTLPAQAQTPAAADAQHPAFRQIRMITPVDGWAVATLPDPDPNWHPNSPPEQIFPGTVAYILRTRDGGRTWANVSPPPSYAMPWSTCDCADNGYSGAFFLDADHAWIVTDDGGLGNQMYTGFRTWRTTDGGKSWQSSTDSIDSTTLNMLDFADTTHGWMMVTDSNAIDLPQILYGTTDGGDTWQALADDGVTPHQHGDALISTPDGGIGAGYHTGLAFVSGQVGWLTWTNSDPSGGGLLRSEDGGRTWANVSLPPDSPLLQADPYVCGTSDLQLPGTDTVSFAAYCTGGARFNDHPQAFQVRTDDNGKTWRSLDLPDAPNGGRWSGTPQVAMMSADMGWMVSCVLPENGMYCDDPAAVIYFFQTTDGGAHWAESPSFPDHFVPLIDQWSGDMVIDFVDAQTAYAPDSTGALWATTDAGTTWTRQSPAIEPLAIPAS